MNFFLVEYKMITWDFMYIVYTCKCYNIIHIFIICNLLTYIIYSTNTYRAGIFMLTRIYTIDKILTYNKLFI